MKILKQIASPNVGSKRLIIPGKKKIHAPLLYFPRWKEFGMSLKPRLKNEYHACIYDKEQYEKYGEKAPVLEEAWAYNVFCNQGLDLIRHTTFTSGSYLSGVIPDGFMAYCGIGTGAGSPAITDTEFFTFLSEANIATEGEVSGPDTASINHSTEEYWHRHKFFWDLDEGNGTLTEVGLCYLDGTFDHILTHAMFQDAEGEPISITKDATKVLIVTVTVYMERGNTDAGAMILDDGIEQIVEQNGVYYQLAQQTYNQGVIYLGDADQAVDAADCYETSYPVLGSTRESKSVVLAAATGSGYGVNLYADWNLNEGNDTWYEVGYRTQLRNGALAGPQLNLARFDLPSGSIGENTLVKTDSNKLRVTIEFYYTQ